VSERIGPDVLKTYPRAVAEVVKEAVNEHGVEFRVIDGGHLRMYCGNRDVIPAKINHNSPEQHILRKLLPWLEENVPTWKDRNTKVTAQAVEILAEVVNTTPRPAPKPVVEQAEQGFKCLRPGCGFVAKSAAGLRMHEAGHTGEKSKQAKKASETYRLRREQEKIVAQQALTALAEMHGLQVVDRGTNAKALEKRTADLEARLEKVTAERDELKARMDLMKEAFRA